MSEKPKEDSNTHNEDGTDKKMPEGFDEPTGPFAKRHAKDTPAEDSNVEDYASYVDTSGDDEEFEEQDSGEQQVKAQLLEAKEQVLRAMAEAENTRKRAIKDREEASKYAISGFARDLLSVADNLRRALDAIPEDSSGVSEHFTNLQTGIEATERELIRALERHGIKQLFPLDEPFDPNFHEVMFEAPIGDKEPGTIIQVMEVGYTLHERLLRPARVGVAKAVDPEEMTGHSIDTKA